MPDLAVPAAACGFEFHLAAELVGGHEADAAAGCRLVDLFGWSGGREGRVEGAELVAAGRGIVGGVVCGGEVRVGGAEGGGWWEGGRVWHEGFPVVVRGWVKICRGWTWWRDVRWRCIGWRCVCLFSVCGCRGLRRFFSLDVGGTEAFERLEEAHIWFLAGEVE